MNLFLDSLWRAAGYCLHPRVVALSLLPLAIMVALSLGLGYFFWDGAIDWVRTWLESSNLLRAVWGWLESMGAGSLKTVVAPLVVIFALTPLIVLASLLLVAALMGPALARLVARRRFPQLERKHGGSLLLSLGWSLGSTLLALLALIVSLPLWLVPPLILLLPPLIWGWLTYRVMAFDALADHASPDERRAIFRRHRLWLLGIGVLTGYLGAAPSVVWASGALFAAAFVILVPVAIWIYTLVFAFASLWFAHYCLAALEQLRAAPPAPPPGPVAFADDANQPAA
ncbi:EI24 domain-containing protein [Ramlibacter sp.]|uniref:EI24 domain-containing protein n=1 Tax=Ramlibacter sp. TaxID=1917967 RepID=UPI002B75CE53|nr:EI24 domain-containing protein [Ramlibacter sp.]HWI83955.1 EI24 domain-containing protein [Ramlibacter sp.]